MKKHLIGLFLIFTSFTYSQTFQASLTKGSTATSVDIVIKPSGNTSGQISSFQFALSIQKSLAGASQPTYTITSFVTGLAYGGTGIQLTDEPAVGEPSYLYTFGGVGDATVTNQSYVGGTEYPIAEVTFTSGSFPLDSVKLIQLPNGGTTANSNFYMAIGGIEVENSTTQFYGSNAVNDGQGFSGTSYVTIAPILPVKFLSFYALKSGDAAKLTWTVSDDVNNQYFDVERSLDGRKYGAFTKVDALANGRDINTYTAVDPVLSKQGAKEIYYRVKQVDRNGTSVYSLIRILNVDNNIPLSLYPNPARSVTKLVLDAPEAGKAAVILRDATGRQVQLINMQLVKGINQKDINVSMLPGGDYHVNVVSEKLNQTIKLTKIN